MKVKGSVITTFEFREIHPHNDAYSVMLNDTQDGVQKFYNKRLLNCLKESGIEL